MISDVLSLPSFLSKTSLRSLFLDSFMQSPGHRANILGSQYNCFGGARSGSFWSQEFGFEASGCPVPNCGYGRLARRNDKKVEVVEAWSAVFKALEEGKTGDAKVEVEDDVKSGEEKLDELVFDDSAKDKDVKTA